MRFIAIVAAFVLPVLALGSAAFAHGDQPHPTCKKGYVLTDDHKCVKAPA